MSLRSALFGQDQPIDKSSNVGLDPMEITGEQLSSDVDHPYHTIQQIINLENQSPDNFHDFVQPLISADKNGVENLRQWLAATKVQSYIALPMTGVYGVNIAGRDTDGQNTSFTFSLRFAEVEA